MRPKQIIIVLGIIAVAFIGGYYSSLVSGSAKYANAIRNLEDAENRARGLSIRYSELERTNIELAGERDALIDNNRKLASDLERARANNQGIINNAGRAIETIGKLEDREQRIAGLFNILETIIRAGIQE